MSRDKSDVQIPYWVLWVGAAIVAFVLSAMFMGAMPDCHHCKSGDLSFAQAWVATVSMALLAASVFFGCTAYCRFVECME